MHVSMVLIWGSYTRVVGGVACVICEDSYKVFSFEEKQLNI